MNSFAFNVTTAAIKKVVMTFGVVVALGLTSVAGFASSPFLVSPASVADHDRISAKQQGTTNPITLAESLVQLRLCHLKDQQSQSDSQASASGHTQTVNK